MAFQVRTDGHRATGRTAGGGVDPQAPPRPARATEEKAMSIKEMKKGAAGDKARVVSDMKMSESVTISVIPRNKGGEDRKEFSPFKPSRRLQRYILYYICRR